MSRFCGFHFGFETNKMCEKPNRARQTGSRREKQNRARQTGSRRVEQTGRRQSGRICEKQNSFQKPKTFLYRKKYCEIAVMQGRMATMLAENRTRQSKASHAARATATSSSNHAFSYVSSVRFWRSKTLQTLRFSMFQRCHE